QLERAVCRPVAGARRGPGPTRAPAAHATPHAAARVPGGGRPATACGVGRPNAIRSRMRLRYTLVADWPPLAWLARCRPGAPAIDVFHGPRVELAADWFCEAVWDGAFADGDFDRTDLVFGSGARARESDGVCFVSSGSTVDRLQSID